MVAATQHHHWHAHPQRIKRGGCSVVGKWIKRNVNGVVAVQVAGLVVIHNHEVQLLGTNAILGKVRKNKSLHMLCSHTFIFKHQARLCNALKNVRPHRDDLRRGLCEIIERTKCNARILE